ncbi:MAG: N-acetylmuramoyl-L-alanine amidase family protein [Coprococcus sp.]
MAALLRSDERFEVRRRNTPKNVWGQQCDKSGGKGASGKCMAGDYFVGIHANANTDLLLMGQRSCLPKYTQSYYLAQHILNAVVNIVGTKDNGVRANPSLYVLRRTNMPAILVELAYLTNAGDAGKLETMQSEFARGIYEGMLSYFGMDQ